MIANQHFLSDWRCSLNKLYILVLARYACWKTKRATADCYKSKKPSKFQIYIDFGDCVGYIDMILLMHDDRCELKEAGHGPLLVLNAAREKLSQQRNVKCKSN
jgi:hypothetical protein